MTKQRIAIFASGSGSNAMNLIQYFKNHFSIEVGFVMSNRNTAPVLEKAKNAGVKTYSFSNKEVADADFLIALCQKENIDWVILAGYLRLIPAAFSAQFENRMINLHPSLLPNYGGKGMYGENVHKAVLANNEKETGITVHYVNAEFDKGRIIAQFRCEISKDETVSSLQEKIHQLEHNYLPKIVETEILA